MSEVHSIVDNAGIVAGGKTELVVSGVTYRGDSYETYAQAAAAKNVVAAENLVFSSNIEIASGHTTALTGGSFSNLAVTSRVNEGAALIVENVFFSGNSAATGGVFIQRGSLTVSGSTFSNNSATTAAVIYSDKGLTTLSDVVFDGNSATNYGAVMITGSTVNLRGKVTLKTTSDTIWSSGSIYVDNADFFADSAEIGVKTVVFG